MEHVTGILLVIFGCLLLTGTLSISHYNEKWRFASEMKAACKVAQTLNISPGTTRRCERLLLSILPAVERARTLKNTLSVGLYVTGTCLLVRLHHLARQEWHGVG